MAATSRSHKTIEKIVDDMGRVTHLKCSRCSWKVAVDGNDPDELVREVYSSFTGHECD
jgi:hypothetical protein